MADRTNNKGERDPGDDGQELEPLDQERKSDSNERIKSGDEHRCGWGPMTFRWMQYLGHPVVYASIMNLVVVFQISAIGVYVSGTLSTIEKRFQLKSSESGFMTTINDIMGMVFVIPITYFGHRLHRPRIVACGSFLVGLGTMICAVPQFIYENPNKEFMDEINHVNQTTVHQDHCILDSIQGQNGSEDCTSKDIADAGSQIDKAMWFIIGQALCGLGQTPIWPLTLTFLDDNVDKTSMPAYLALLFASTTIAPIYGYVLSASCLSLDVDFYKPSGTSNALKPGDPNFIGAWWLGYLINGFALCFLSLFVAGFPKVLPKRRWFKKKCNANKKKPPKTLGFDYADMMKGPGIREGATLTTLIIDFFKTFRRLFTNLAFLCVVGSLIAEIAIISGFGIFSAKYIQKQYGVPASRASLILGFLLTPAGLLGVATCGIFLKKFPLTVRGYARLAAIVAGSSLILGSFLLATGCTNPPIAGLTVNYHQQREIWRASVRNLLPNTTAACNADCFCETGRFKPVCGGDGITYVTACHAGCEHQETLYDENGQQFTIYKECACIPSDLDDDDQASTLNDARIGQCNENCNKLVMFAVLYGFVIFISAWIKNPCLMLLLRVVHEDDRTIALGFNSISIKLLGFLPAPIYFGAAIESTCILWNESCGRTGDCLVYDLTKYRYVFLGLLLCLKTMSLLGFTLVAILAERAHAKAGRFQALSTADGKATEDDINNIKMKEKTKNTINKYEKLSNGNSVGPTDV